MSDEPVIFDGPHLFHEDGSLNVWVPFEERPRPPQLGRVTITYTAKRIEIFSQDEKAIGDIMGWLFGQSQLARKEEGHGRP